MKNLIYIALCYVNIRELQTLKQSGFSTHPVVIFNVSFFTNNYLFSVSFFERTLQVHIASRGEAQDARLLSELA